MSAGQGVSWRTWAGVVVLVLLGVWFLRWALRSDAQRVSDAVDEARDALVEGRDEDFLAFFAPDVTYRGRGDMEQLERDLAQWRRLGVSQVFILDREIEVQDGIARVQLTVAVGQQLLNIEPVGVDLLASEDEEGEWRVRAFDWHRTR